MICLFELPNFDEILFERTAKIYSTAMKNVILETFSDILAEKSGGSAETILEKLTGINTIAEWLEEPPSIDAFPVDYDHFIRNYRRK